MLLSVGRTLQEHPGASCPWCIMVETQSQWGRRSSGKGETLGRQSALEQHCSRALELKYLPFLSAILHIPRKTFRESSQCAVKFHLQANRHKTHWERENSQPGPAVCFCKSKLLRCKFTGEERAMTNSPSGVSISGLLRLTAISSIATYLLPTGALWVLHKQPQRFSSPSSANPAFCTSPSRLARPLHPDQAASSCSGSTPIWNIAWYYSRQLCLFIVTTWARLMVLLRSSQQKELNKATKGSEISASLLFHGNLPWRLEGGLGKIAWCPCLAFLCFPGHQLFPSAREQV